VVGAGAGSGVGWALADSEDVRLLAGRAHVVAERPGAGVASVSA
jgi:hypothetical protein